MSLYNNLESIINSLRETEDDLTVAREHVRAQRHALEAAVHAMRLTEEGQELPTFQDVKGIYRRNHLPGGLMEIAYHGNED